MDLAARGVVTAAGRLRDAHRRVPRRALVVSEKEIAAAHQEVILAAESGVVQLLEGFTVVEELLHDGLEVAEINEGGGLTQHKVHPATLPFGGGKPIAVAEGLPQD